MSTAGASEIQERLKKIRMLVLDTDGVLTDGRMIYDDCDCHIKFFDAADGLGITLLRKAGILTYVITSKKSRAMVTRAKDLKIAGVYQNVSNKRSVFESLLKKCSRPGEEACYMGDDLVDIPVLKRCGFAVAVQNAVSEVKSLAHYVTVRSGGRGAVREIAEMILKSQDKWDIATREYFE